MKKFLLLFFIPLLSISKAQELDLKLKTFETDGCTMFVDGTPSKPGLWRHCCFEHDLRYWFGGSLEDLDKTDLQLKSCVNKVAGPLWASLIYDGVRAGHSSPIKNKTQWSWGWETVRSNTILSPLEKTYIIEELHRLPYDQAVINNFIEQTFKN